MTTLFDRIIEPDLERVPVLTVAHVEEHLGRNFRLLQTISRNVLTEFDRKLSRHLAATTGAGFPAFTVTVEVVEPGVDGTRRHLATAAHNSVPHALLEIAKRAHARCGPVELTFHRGSRKDAEEKALGPSRAVGTDEIEMLEAALKICATLGEAEFLEIAGDFDVVLVTPPGGLRPIAMHLQNGTLSIPSVHSATDAPFECPIFGFADHIAHDLGAQNYLAQARHALVTEKTAAIDSFRLAAEKRILAVSEALGGRGLSEHRQLAVEGLVERLRAGLGSNLKGLAEDARITALDWSCSLGECVEVTVPRAASG